jgi:hypothetical protein
MNFKRSLSTGSLLSLLVLTSFAIAGCATSKDGIFESEKTQLELRSIQSRAFDTTDREQTLRTIIATLQDLGFVIDNADAVLGSVSGTKLNYYALRMTVTIRPRAAHQLLVGANAQYNLQQVAEPEPYQQFFTALSRSMFLEAHQVD